MKTLDSADKVFGKLYASLPANAHVVFDVGDHSTADTNGEHYKVATDEDARDADRAPDPKDT